MSKAEIVAAAVVRRIACQNRVELLTRRRRNGAAVRQGQRLAVGHDDIVVVRGQRGGGGKRACGILIALRECVGPAEKQPAFQIFRIFLEPFRELPDRVVDLRRHRRSRLVGAFRERHVGSSGAADHAVNQQAHRRHRDHDQAQPHFLHALVLSRRAGARGFRGQ